MWISFINYKYLPYRMQIPPFTTLNMHVLHRKVWYNTFRVSLPPPGQIPLSVGSKNPNFESCKTPRSINTSTLCCLAHIASYIMNHVSARRHLFITCLHYSSRCRQVPYRGEDKRSLLSRRHFYGSNYCLHSSWFESIYWFVFSTVLAI